MRNPELAAKQFVVVRKITYGPFSTAKEASEWAQEHWPNEEPNIQGLHDPRLVKA